MVRSDIYFAADDAHAFLPWIIGIMACLATLLLCFGVTAGSWIIDRHDAYAGSFTVNVPDAGSDHAGLDKIQAALHNLHGVQAITPLGASKLHALLKPWLGNGEGLDELPLPAVLDVAADPAASIDYAALQAKLDAIVPGTEVDGHEQWIDGFMHFSAAMQGLLVVLSTLVVGGMALMIAFTSRAALKLHARTVQLLHSIGAEDGYIARQFQRDACLLTLRGTLPGCLLAGLAFKAAGLYLASLQVSTLPDLALTGAHLALLLSMPLACAIVATLAARLSVLRQLRHTL